MTHKLILNLFPRDIPNPDDFVLGAGREVPSIGGKTDGTDVQITLSFCQFVVESHSFLTGFDIEDLRGSVAAGGDVFPVSGESDATDDAVVFKGVENGDVQLAGDLFVEDREPIFPLAFVVCGGGIQILIDEGES